MRKSYMVALSAAVLSLGILTGCSELSNKKDAQKTALDWIEQAKIDGLNKELSTTQEIDSASVLQLENTIGNIEIKPGKSDKITVNASIWSMRDKADYQKILDQAEVSVIVKGKNLEILTHPKDNQKKNLWSWAEDKYGLSDFTIDYIIELPAAINSYEVTNEVGEITLSHLKGTYQVHNNVGTIHLQEAHILGESSIKSEAGNLQLGINEMDQDSNLNAKTEVGTILATLAESLQCSLNAESELGRITGAAKGENEINGGGPSLSLTTSVGSITVERV